MIPLIHISKTCALNRARLFNQRGTKMSISKPDAAVNPKQPVEAKSLGAPVQTSHICRFVGVTAFFLARSRCKIKHVLSLVGVNPINIFLLLI